MHGCRRSKTTEEPDDVEVNKEERRRGGGRIGTGNDRRTLEGRYFVGETSCRNFGTLLGTSKGQGTGYVMLKWAV